MLRSLVLTSLVLSAGACSESKKEPPPAPEKSETPPPAAAPGPAKADPAPAPVVIDCEALVTADDVKKACGAGATGVEVTKGSMETGAGATHCMRTAALAGKKIDAVRIAVNSAPQTPEGARALLKTSAESKGSKPVEVGEQGVLNVQEMAQMKQMIHTVEAVKGRVYLKVGTATSKETKKPMCKDDGLVALAKIIAERLP